MTVGPGRGAAQWFQSSMLEKGRFRQKNVILTGFSGKPDKMTLSKIFHK